MIHANVLSSSPLLRNLRRQAKAIESDTPLEHLWLAYGNWLPHRPLKHLQTAQQCLVTHRADGNLPDERPFVSDTSNDTQLDRFLNEACEAFSLRSLVVCRQSHVAGTERPESLANSRQREAPVTELLVQSKRRETVNDQLRRQLLKEWQQVLHLPSIASRVARNKLSVKAVFYLAESDLFTQYHPGAEHFLPQHF